LIGAGGFSQIYLGTQRSDNTKCAIKVIKKQKLSGNVKDRMALIKEIEIMRQIDHPRIIKLYEVYETSTAIYLITEYVPGDELLKHIETNDYCSEKNASIIIKCILEALVYCHDKNIIHRDLKPEKIILT
jgi:serine/threonine protein kinase